MRVGDTVRLYYHTGVYIGTFIEDRDTHAVIQVVAVLKHPLQGDIHNPREVENVFFHERKALAYREKASAAKTAIQPYEDDVPEYGVSLKTAVENMREKLRRKDELYNKRALDSLDSLESHAYKTYY